MHRWAKKLSNIVCNHISLVTPYSTFSNPPTPNSTPRKRHYWLSTIISTVPSRVNNSPASASWTCLLYSIQSITHRLVRHHWNSTSLVRVVPLDSFLQRLVKWPPVFGYTSVLRRSTGISARTSALHPVYHSAQYPPVCVISGSSPLRR